MMRRLGSLLAFLCGACLCVEAQKAAEFPQHIVIASDSFFDFGPPFNYYDITTVDSTSSGVHVERALVTPQGLACLQPPKVELQQADVPITMSQLLKGKNPCDIPEKDLKKELKRCKHCMTFSGIITSMETSCKATPRTIRMDILDQDLFDRRTATPGNTSWTMEVLGALNKSLGPGPMDKPMFDLEPGKPAPDAKIVQKHKAGEYDHFFAPQEILSKLAKEAEIPPPVQTVELTEAMPTTPVTAEMPKYPPIARLAHIEGDASFLFEVTPKGGVEKIVPMDGSPILLNDTVKASFAKWKFAASGQRYQEHATLTFRMNCDASASWH